MTTEISSLEYDSRQVRPHSIFFAISGYEQDGNAFVPQAVFNGASAIVSERPMPADFPAVWAQVPRIRQYMAELANHYYGHPSKQLRLAGVTGTNGKTTTCYLIHSILSASGRPALLLSTVETILADLRQSSSRTTPEAIEIQLLLSRALQKRCKTGVIEVSSHALALDRTYQCELEVGVFTNLSQDHLDFHGSLEDYLSMKARLFDPGRNPGIRCAVLNGDDSRVSGLPLASSVRRMTFGCSPSHDVFPRHVETGMEGTRALVSVGGESLSIESPLAGEHNLYNLMSAVAASTYLELPKEQIQEGIASLTAVPGRFERVLLEEAPFAAFVDYAHTPDALLNVLRLARGICQGRLICLFGCGGDRDRGKRPRMGRIAAANADIVILTSDNPRSEDPQAILQQIEMGIPAGTGTVESILDRREAIERALRLAGSGDLVLIAGKGHETYQEVKGSRLPFDDVLTTQEIYDHGLPG